MAQAYEFALEKVGMDMHSYSIYADYISFLKSAYVLKLLLLWIWEVRSTNSCGLCDLWNTNKDIFHYWSAFLDQLWASMLKTNAYLPCVKSTSGVLSLQWLTSSSFGRNIVPTKKFRFLKLTLFLLQLFLCLFSCSSERECNSCWETDCWKK